MIYHFLKQIVKLSLFIFFKKIVVTGKENIPKKGPMIIVANHPNTFMDPLIILALTNQRIGFVGNAGIFSNKIMAKIFKYFHVIPIFRKKDILPGEKPDNKEAFVKCHEYLNQENTLLIFPEGNSYYELKLRKIKTGTARIALSFEALHNFEANLQILPIALDYSDSIQFRSMVSVTINPPISIASFKESYTLNESDGVLELTESIRKELVKNIPQTSGKEQEEFLVRAHKFFTTYNHPSADLYLDPKQSLELRNQVSKSMHILQKHNDELYKDTQTKLHHFFKMLKEEGLTTGFFTDQFLKKNALLVCFNYFIKFIFLFPIYIYGLLVNYIAYILPSKIFYILNIDIEYKTPVEMTSGIITFPLLYSLQIWLFRNYISEEFWYSFLLLLSFPISGFIAMFYYTEIKRFARVVHFYFFIKPEMKFNILELRNKIINNIEKARKSLIVK